MNRDREGCGALDVFEAADLLVSQAIEHHGDEIDIIAYYGSYAQGVARKGSDLDIFYIPADGKNPPVGHTVLISGLLFDFWAIPWSTMEAFASGQARGWSLAPAIVHHARVLYSRSDEQATRFATLKQQVLDLQTPEARPQMLQRAGQAFERVLVHLGSLRLAAASDDFSDVRNAGWHVILSAWECLALANQTLFDRGWGHIIEQIPRLRSKPEMLEEQVVLISTSDDPQQIVSAAEGLALGTRQILRKLLAEPPAQRTAAEVFDNSYPEIKEGIGKVIMACKRQKAAAASAAAWSIQSELSMMLNSLHSNARVSDADLYSEFASLYRRLDFPDLMQTSCTDLPRLADQARLLDQQLRQWLQEQSVKLCEFETLDEFERSLAKNAPSC